MSTRRYIELYSGNRNRHQFPLPAYFEVPFSPVRKLNSPLQALDPILSGVIYYKWQGGLNLTGTLKNNSNDSVLYLRPSVGDLSSVFNYYLGYNFTINAPNSPLRMIKSYEPSNASVLLNLAFNSIVGATEFSITDSSTSSIIHIPTRDIHNFNILCYSQSYHNYYIVDETLSNGTNIVSRKIINYDFMTQMATLDAPFPPGWNITDTYTLRKTLPQESWKVALDPNGTKIYIDYNPSQQLTNYVGKYVYDVDADPDIATEGIYNSFFINNAEFVSIDSKQYLELTLSMNGMTFPLKNHHINIVFFIQDNFAPLNYNGTIVSQNESVCYEITLISLTLPNSPLITGSRVMFYPYVYVEFSNVSISSGSSKDIIYSNNPMTTRALFIAPVTDSSQPMNKGFVKIDAGAMTQTVKFKPNEGLRMSVYLPNGSLFQTVETDYYSPYPPNDLVQVGAVFAIRRAV